MFLRDTLTGQVTSVKNIPLIYLIFHWKCSTICTKKSYLQICIDNGYKKKKN
uniref:Uncharacterized protein n=1 Tax=Anguilla anguilla TaxID=7936 RepID=A0A0E9XN00_ANGAN